MSDLFQLEDCPDSVWELLPGGRDAVDQERGESWRYRGTFVAAHRFVHRFQHERHPLYGGARVHAHIADGDAGPRLASLLVISADDELPNEVGQELRW